MAIPSLEGQWRDEKRIKPRILVLEVRDRNLPEGQPIGWVLVEREETYRRDPRDGSIYEASISLSYQRITAKFSHRDGGKGRFDGGYSRGFNSVSLTSSSTSRGAVFLDLPGLYGQRIGTYLMNEIVQWVKQWPEAKVNSVELREEQGYDENKDRRNWFYEQFGLVFDYTDVEHRAGHSRSMLVTALTPVEKWKANIRERHVLDYLAEVLYAEERASLELAQRERGIKSLLDDRKQAEAKPLRWALRMLWWRYSSTVMGSAIVAGLVALAWLKLNA